jgi:hypothetical protein
MRPVDDILTDDAQPRDEPPEHAIGGEFSIRACQLSYHFD